MENSHLMGDKSVGKSRELKDEQIPSLTQTVPSNAWRQTQRFLAEQKAHASLVEAQRLARLAAKERT